MPLALGQLGQMILILTDLHFLGKLGPGALGGAGFASSAFYLFTLFGAGTLMGLDPFVALAFGRGANRECRYWLVQGNYLALLLGVPFALTLYSLSRFLGLLGFESSVSQAASQLLATLSLSLPLYLVFIAYRQYLQAVGSIYPAALITFSAIFMNAFLNWTLIFGNLGFPELRVYGSGLATALTRLSMVLALVLWSRFRESDFDRLQSRVSGAPDFSGIARLARMGIPLGGQLVLKSSVLFVATALAGKLGAIALAAHTIAMNIASLTYMIPYGFSSASAVRVAHAFSRHGIEEAEREGWASLYSVTVLMLAVSALLIWKNQSILSLFSSSDSVLKLGTPLFFLMACFQIADGWQSVGSGALRGLGDTRSGFRASLIGYWAIGLPLGFYLCRRLDVIGLWIGLTAGLFAVSFSILIRWKRRSAQRELFITEGVLHV